MFSGFRKKAAKVTQSAAAPEVIPAAASPPPVPSNGKRILVVEDNPLEQKALSFKLQSSGYEVLSAVDGAGAVSAARQQNPDLILLDLSFPPDVAHGGGVPWDGFLIMSWLKRLEPAKAIPIIVLSGAPAAQYKARALEAGALDYFEKPVEPAVLLGAIDQALQPRRSPAGHPAPQR